MAARKARRVLRSGSPPSSKPTIPDSLKERLQTGADALVEEVLKPRSVKPPPTEPLYNYIVNVYTRWWRSYFYFCATYACPGPNAISPTFEVRFARLEYAEGERFHMAFMRYTGEWIEIFRDVPLDRALVAIRDDTYFRLS